MIVHAKRKELLALAKGTAKAALKAHEFKALSGILLEADDCGVLRLTATNMEVAIRTTMPTSVEMPGSGVISAGLFLGMLEKLDGEEVSLELIRTDYFSVKSGSAKYEISAIPEDFPQVDIPMPGGTVTVSGLKTLIAKAAPVTSKSDDRGKVYQCVNLALTESGLVATATNGHSFAEISGDKDCAGKISLLVPASSLKILASIAHDSDVYEMGLTGQGGKSVVFYDGTLLLSARLIEGDFLSSEKVLGSFTPKITATVNASDLKAAITNVATAASSGGQIGIDFTESGLTLSCVSEDSHATTQISCGVLKPDGKRRFYGIGNLTNCLRTLSGEIAVNVDATGNLMLADAQARCLVIAQREMKKKAAAKAAA